MEHLKNVNACGQTGEQCVDSGPSWSATSGRELAHIQQPLRKRHQAVRRRRKGWLFADTVAGSQASANLYPLAWTCKANGTDPYRYLVSLFAKLHLPSTADNYAALMSWATPAAPSL